MTSDEYWEARHVEFEARKQQARPPRFVFQSLPVPSLRGERRVVVSPKLGGYRWFVSDSTQLSQPGACSNYAEGFSFHYGRAIRVAEAAAVASMPEQ